MSAEKLWYRQPAKEYMAGLPIGTGRLAAMVLGTVTPERVALNHEWLWRGENRTRENAKSAHLLPEVRELLLAGKYEEGTLKGNQAFGGPGGVSGTRNRVDPYQPAGDLHFAIEHGETTDYRRELDLANGLVTVAYTAEGVRFTRQYLAHIPKDVILIRIAADRPFHGSFWLERKHDPQCCLRHETTANSLAMDGQFERGIAFRVQAWVETPNGQVTVDGNRLMVRGADEIIVAINIGTSAKTDCPAWECRPQAVAGVDWAQLLREHAAAYRKLYRTLELHLDVPGSDLPTDERLRSARERGVDPQLPLLYFNLGRYLMVAATATGDLPPNLQGKWNEDLEPPWQADYHHDVNLQMNYWPAEAGNLAAATEPLFRHLERFVPHARKAAHDLYGCRGVWYPIQTDPWGRSTAESYGWAVWVGAAAWLAQHLWWHYEYGQDIVFLRDRAYPFLKEVAEFYESYLLADAHGQLQVVPSQSPENRIPQGGKLPVTLCVSATMDVVLIQDALEHAIRAAERLEVDADRRQTWQSILDRLPPLKVGRHGQLQEWNEDFDEVEPGHRHFSHMIGLYPGDQLDPERTPALWTAAKRALERRLAHSGGHTGWSRSWTACMFARLGDAGKAWEHLAHLITDFATDSLLDLHPPRIFQIDGNFGGTAAVLEMLLQSYREELHFLPALPAAWKSGQVRGVRARGGFTVGLEWRDERLARAEIVSCRTRVCTIRFGAGQYTVRTGAGKNTKCSVKGQHLCFNARRGQLYIVAPLEARNG